MQDISVLIPVVFPVFVGLLLLISPFFRENGRALRAVLGVTFAVNAALVLSVVLRADAGFTLFSASPRVEIGFAVDAVGRLFAALIALIWPLVGVYAFSYMKHEKNEHRFFGFYMMLFGVLLGIVWSGNYLTMYVFYELMTLLSVPLVLHSGTPAALAAAKKYLFYSLFGAFLGLFGFFFLGQYATRLTFEAGGVLDAARLSGHEGAVLIAVMLVLLGFGTKAGMFPLQSWLPTAHPEAPSPASAALSGIITKMGVFAIIRVVFYVVGADFLRGTWVQYTWLSLAAVTVILGSVMAYREKTFKKRLAYSTVSQVSYILLGLAVLQPAAFAGGLLHVVFHALMKCVLFMSAGAVIVKTGQTQVDSLDGVSRRMPRVMALYTVASLGLIGIPPLSGFVSKWMIATGAAESGVSVFWWLLPAALLLSAVLTAGYLLSVSLRGYFGGKPDSAERCDADRTMLAPMLIFTLLTVLLGIFAQPLVSFAASIAGAVL